MSIGFFESFTSTNDNLSASGCFSIFVISGLGDWDLGLLDCWISEFEFLDIEFIGLGLPDVGFLDWGFLEFGVSGLGISGSGIPTLPVS